MSVQLFKDGDAMAIRTDCRAEDQFVCEFVELLSGMIEDGYHENDWGFQLGLWLPQFADICCAFRGHESDARKETVILAGDTYGDAPRHEIKRVGDRVTISHSRNETPQRHSEEQTT